MLDDEYDDDDDDVILLKATRPLKISIALRLYIGGMLSLTVSDSFRNFQGQL